MSRPQRVRLALLPLLPAALAALVWLGFTAFRETLPQAGGTPWLMGWVLAFLVGMPVLVLGLAIAGAAQTHGQRHRLALHSGEKIPGAGQ